MARPKLADDEKKAKRLTIRLDAGTYAAWQRKALVAGAPLAVWVREQVEIAAAADETGGPGRPPHTPVDPRLVRQLAGIGSNINQLARAANSQKLDWRLDLIAYLIDVERALRAMRTQYLPRPPEEQ